MALAPGARLGPYEVLSLLGTGRNRWGVSRARSEAEARCRYDRRRILPTPRAQGFDRGHM